ncbi:hypothetical protein BDV95DRAFT_130656 [Massariosphaeria phaeospora]|uniref:Fungal N-terminal domain-containing protein n=1 Tax=Massariosphaeria phaeospora TaxID=100035 RepID=A0A7C8M859_9PLEO|nr:hypothetical protein BDV95DRAFT_130656 [Massariosphaeria phaeospora]
MPVAFGYSASDIALAIQLLSKVYKGLKETGGSASEFQDISEFLKGLISTLQHLQTLQLECSNPSLVNAVRALSNSALNPIFEFIDEVSKYEPALKRQSAISRVGSSYRKAEWAVRIPKRLAKLKADAVLELEPIHLLLESETLKRCDVTASRISSLEKDLNARASEQSKFNATLLASIRGLSSSTGGTQCCPSTIPRHGTSTPPDCVSREEAGSLSPTNVTMPSPTFAQLEPVSWAALVGEHLYIALLNILAKLRSLTLYLLCVHLTVRSYSL